MSPGGGLEVPDRGTGLFDEPHPLMAEARPLLHPRERAADDVADRLRGDRRRPYQLELRREVGFDLAVEAPGAMAEERLAGFIVLVPAVGAEIRLVHVPSVRASSASWVARS